MKTTPRYTTTRLTIPLGALPRARAIAGGVVLAIVVLAFALDALERRPAATQEPQPLVVRPQIVYIVATPTPQPPAPTVEPAVMSEPPTAEPVIIYEPVYIEVEAVPTVAPATAEPAVIGEVVSWDGNVQQIAP